jgi:hypothetical protein
MSRRANGEGTVYHRADGRWEGAGYVLHADGIRRRVRVYGATRKQAQDKLDALLADNARGLPLAVDRTVTVGTYLRWWLNRSRCIDCVRPRSSPTPPTSTTT